MTDILVAVITGLASVAAVMVTNSRMGAEMNYRLDKAQAVTETKLDELTREVREHNNFAKRIPVVEEQIRVINHRIEDLENRHRPG